MHRIDTAGNLSGLFTDGDPSAGQQATVVNEDWLNSMQEELVAVVQAGGLTLNKAVRTQVRDALRALYGTFPRQSWSYTDPTGFSSDGTPKPVIYGSRSYWSGSGTAQYTIGGRIHVPPGATIQAVEILAQNSGTTSVNIDNIAITARDASGTSGPVVDTTINGNTTGSGTARVTLAASGTLAWWPVTLAAGTLTAPASGWLYMSMELLVGSAADKLRVYGVRVRYSQTSAGPGI